MGAFTPSPLVDDALQLRIMREIVDPVVAGLAADGHPYSGFLYAGLMLTCDGPKVIEFNVRFGDPEAQVVIPISPAARAATAAAARRSRRRELLGAYTCRRRAASRDIRVQ
jgi:phosphoribosylamine--glycine ligase